MSKKKVYWVGVHHVQIPNSFSDPPFPQALAVLSYGTVLPQRLASVERDLWAVLVWQGVLCTPSAP